MAVFGNKPKTAQQKAQWAKTSITLRTVALLYVVFYVIIPMINPEAEEIDSMSPLVRYGVLAFFILVSGYLIISTIMEFIRNNNAGRYRAEAYTDDEGIVIVESIAKENESEEIIDEADFDDNYDEDDYEDGDDKDYDEDED